MQQWLQADTHEDISLVKKITGKIVKIVALYTKKSNMILISSNAAMPNSCNVFAF